MRVSNLLNTYITLSLCTTLLMISVYNLVGDITLIFFGIHALATLLVLLIYWFKSYSSIQKATLIAILLSIYVLLTDAPTINFDSTSRITIFIYLAILPVIATSKLTDSQLYALYLSAAVALIVAGTQAFAMEPIVAGTERLAPFIGGDDGLHPSAYSVLAMFYLLLKIGRIRMPMGKFTHYILLILSIILLFEYRVRTTWVMLLIIFLVTAWYGTKTLATQALKIFTVIMTLVLTFVILTIDLTAIENSQRFTSGRSIIWLERIGQVMSSDVTTIMIGKGSGSDRSYGTLLWAHSAKDSHQDFLRILIEHGLFGLILFLTLLSTLSKKLPKESKIILLAMIASSVVSNGVLLRPSILALYTLMCFGTAVQRKK